MLDPDYINRAAPPGSMRYFALLYTPLEHRELMTALFVVEAEIRASATQVSHDVAHSRMQWWRAEIDRLINRNAQHPATQVVQAQLPNADFAILHELMVAADMDLARMTYNTAQELDAYLQRSGGAVFELTATHASSDARKAIRNLGGLIRRVETLRDLILESRAGRIYCPLDELEKHNVAPDQLHDAKNQAVIRTLIATETARVRNALDTIAPPANHIITRPLTVLTALSARLAQRIAKSDHDIFTQRHELGPLEKVWTAWRAARRS